MKKSRGFSLIKLIPYLARSTIYFKLESLNGNGYL